MPNRVQTLSYREVEISYMLSEGKNFTLTEEQKNFLFILQKFCKLQNAEDIVLSEDGISFMNTDILEAAQECNLLQRTSVRERKWSEINNQQVSILILQWDANWKMHALEQESSQQLYSLETSSTMFTAKNVGIGLAITTLAAGEYLSVLFFYALQNPDLTVLSAHVVAGLSVFATVLVIALAAAVYHCCWGDSSEVAKSSKATQQTDSNLDLSAGV